MKRWAKIFVVVIMITVLTVTASAYTSIYYWDSDASQVYPWSSMPVVISRYNIDGSHSSNMSTGYDTARSQWGAVSGISFLNYGAYPGDTDIRCWEGYRSTLNSTFNLSLGTNINGHTINTHSLSADAMYSYNGTTKYLHYSSHASVYIVDRDLISGISDIGSQYKNVYTHEVGHALGFYGHSTSNNEVMYAYTSGVFSLKTNEKNHLKQFYN